MEPTFSTPPPKRENQAARAPRSRSGRVATVRRRRPPQKGRPGRVPGKGRGPRPRAARTPTHDVCGGPNEQLRSAHGGCCVCGAPRRRVSPFSLCASGSASRAAPVAPRDALLACPATGARRPPPERKKKRRRQEEPATRGGRRREEEEEEEEEEEREKEKGKRERKRERERKGDKKKKKRDK